MRDPLYRFAGEGWQLEVFDERISLIERRVAVAMTLSDEVSRLAQLRERGVLSEDEFTAAKQRILGETR